MVTIYFLVQANLSFILVIARINWEKLLKN